MKPADRESCEIVSSCYWRFRVVSIMGESEIRTSELTSTRAYAIEDKTLKQSMPGSQYSTHSSHRTRGRNFVPSWRESHS